MRKGRGLVDLDVFNELVRHDPALLLDHVCNRRFDKRTNKIRVEISEDAWPEVKRMAAALKKAKALRSKR